MANDELDDLDALFNDESAEEQTVYGVVNLDLDDEVSETTESTKESKVEENVSGLEVRELSYVLSKYNIMDDMGAVLSNINGKTYIWAKNKDIGCRVTHNGYLFGDEGLKVSLFESKNFINILNLFNGKADVKYDGGECINVSNGEIDAQVYVSDDEMVAKQYAIKTLTDAYKISENSTIMFKVDSEFISNFAKATSVIKSSISSFVVKKNKLYLVVGDPEDKKNKISIELSKDVVFQPFDKPININTAVFKKILALNKNNKITVKVNGIFYVLVEDKGFKTEYISGILTK